MIFYLHKKITTALKHKEKQFDQLMNLQGQCFRAQEGRATQRIVLNNEAYFIKQHTGVGFKEIIKNLLQGRLPVISAKNEWQALLKLEKLNIAAPKVLAYGERGCNPAKKESFVLMQALEQTISLETLTANWRSQPPTYVFKMRLIKKVAEIARQLHQHGINHRDLYICHLLLDSEQAKNTSDINLKIFLLDLHRAQIRKRTPMRWLIKDLAALYFSSKNIGLTQRDLLRFIRVYTQQSLATTLTKEHIFWQKVKNRGDKLYRAHG